MGAQTEEQQVPSESEEKNSFTLGMVEPWKRLPRGVCSVHPADGQNTAEQCLGQISVADTT